ncbi:hypothetical protein BD289DRAFT_427739 [Coniella lustricola]|uniref:F-box domain-containing protein n=1 Tax=Coniella lustricola TaxID=2025994 RepID=A0A2T3AF07_9PEZI|nr:hypothetical protein BD289DRAFT_427739 [Coniella lustricola]
MPVPLGTARFYEYSSYTDRCSIAKPSVSIEVQRAVVDFFIACRVDDWKTVCGEYWKSTQLVISKETKDHREEIFSSSSSIKDPGLHLHIESPSSPVKVVESGSLREEYNEGAYQPWEVQQALQQSLYERKGSKRHAPATSRPREEGECLGKEQPWDVKEALQKYRRDRIGSEFYGFMDLPPEIRRVIYEYVLVQGQVPVSVCTRTQRCIDYWEHTSGRPYTRYQDLWYQSDNPWEFGFNPGGHIVCHDHCTWTKNERSMGLIKGVNRTVTMEAVPIYYGCNRFIFPVMSSIPPRCWLGGDEYSRYHRLLRDVSYTFDMREFGHFDDHGNLYYDRRIKRSIDKGRLSRAEAMQLLHDQRTSELEIKWVERIDLIKQMVLRRLTLSFDEAYCRVGCCRKVDWLLDRFLYSGPLPGFDALDDRHVYSSRGWSGGPPQVIEIMGWANKAEREMIEAKLKQLPNAASEINFAAPFSIDDSDSSSGSGSDDDEQ